MGAPVSYGVASHPPKEQPQFVFSHPESTTRPGVEGDTAGNFLSKVSFTKP